jgi:hypothetical protein
MSSPGLCRVVPGGHWCRPASGGSRARKEKPQQVHRAGLGELTARPPCSTVHVTSAY